MRVCLDTNTLMNGIKLNEYEKVYIPIVVLEELDKLKTSENGDKAYKARQAIRRVKSSDNVEVSVSCTYSLPHYLNREKADNIILGHAKQITTTDKKCILLTGDYAMLCKAEALDIPCQEWLGVECDVEYKGYKKLSGNTDFINTFFEDIDNGVNTYGFLENEYLILNNEDLNKISEWRFSQGKFVKLSIPNSKVIKGMNAHQRCAIDLLNNKDISIVSINGTVGSGKTFLGLQMALYHTLEKGNQSRILAVREALGEGEEVGFLKGTFEDKTKLFFKPIEQSLQGKEFELDSLIQNGTLESNIPFYLKGTTYHNTVILVDEAEDLSDKQVKLIGTRLGQNSRIFFCGDYKQATRNCHINNPLVKMCNALKGHPKFGCLYLEEDVRSETSKIFADL